MRTVLVNGAFLTQKITGGQRYAMELLSSLARIPDSKYKYVVAVPGSESDMTHDLPGVVIHCDKTLLPRVLWQQVKLPFLAWKLKADILWSPCNIGPVLPFKAHIATVFDGAIYNDKNWFDWKFKLYYKSVFSAYKYTTARITTCSNFSKDEIVRHMGISPKSVDVVYGAVSEDFRKVPGNKILDGRYVLSLGSRDPRKNVVSLIKAWGQIPVSAKNECRLAIAGGKNKTFAEEALGAEAKDVVFLGYVADADLPGLYSNADCFIYPSFYEGFGLPPLEAMSCGCPVVVSRVASLPEVCGESAIYIDPYSVVSIARGIQEVISAPQKRDKLSLAGLETAKKFTWHKSALKMSEVFDVVYCSDVVQPGV